MFDTCQRYVAIEVSDHSSTWSIYLNHLCTPSLKKKGNKPRIRLHIIARMPSLKRIQYVNNIRLISKPPKALRL